MPDWDVKEAELRASGWDDSEIRKYRNGYESVQTGASMSIPVNPVREPEPYLVADQLRPLPKGDRGVWYRNTPAGQLRALLEPDPPGEQADEARRAREFADDFEYTYGRRPSLTEARHAVARRSDGAFMSGEVKELAAAFRRAGIRRVVLDGYEPLPVDPVKVIHQPVTK